MPVCRSLTKPLALLAYAMAILVAASDVAAQSDEVVLPLTKEPNHHIHFDNGKVRQVEVFLKQGQSSFFHEHTHDNFFVFLNTTTEAVQTIGKPAGIRVAKPGEVGFSSVANGPYTHRVGASSEAGFHVADIEIITKGNLGPVIDRPKRPEKSFTLALENSRGRAYQMILKGGETTESFTRPANTAIFAVSGGRVTEISDGQPPRYWDSESGNFRWSETVDHLTIKNDGVTDLMLVEIEIF
jgi:hypothetical protein